MYIFVWELGTFIAVIHGYFTYTLLNSGTNGDPLGNAKDQ